MMLKSRFLIAVATLLLGVSIDARAALIPGVVQTFPDVSMVNATTGRLYVVTQTDSRYEGATAGGSTQAQVYGAITQRLAIDIISTGTNGTPIATPLGRVPAIGPTGPHRSCCRIVSYGFGNAVCNVRWYRLAPQALCRAHCPPDTGRLPVLR